MKKNIFNLLIVLGILTISSSVVFAEEQQKPAVAVSDTGELTVTDILGRDVTVSMPVKKIAFFHPGTADALLILDVWDMVVGKTGWRLDPDIFPDLDKITSITPALPWSFDDTNVEVLLDLSPDLLILKKGPMPGLEKLLAGLDGIIPVVVVGTGDYSTMNESFRILGKILDRETEAGAFLSWSNGIVRTVTNKLKGLPAETKPKVFYKASYSTAEEISTATDELSAFFVASRIAGGINIAGKIKSSGGWIPKVDQEWLIKQDYDILLIRDSVRGGFGHKISDPALVRQHRAKVMALPVFESSKAVKNNRVYMAMTTFFGAPKSVVGFAYFAKAFHPELFAGMNPEVYLQAYYTRFLRTNIDVGKGVFFYPKL